MEENRQVGPMRILARKILTQEQRNRIYQSWLERKTSVQRKIYKDSITSNWQALQNICLRHIVPITEPVVLISQAGRSGGTLLSQLFDGHPECHAHPYEFRLGGPKRFDWPELDLDQKPEQWFKALFETVSIRLFKEGYRKGRSEDNEFLFLLLPYLQRAIFINQISSHDTLTKRDVYNAYLTSYFNGWVNNQNIHGPKKIVTGFCPWTLIDRNNVCSFFEVYPDGYLISLIREPKSWYSSMKRHSKEFADIPQTMKMWIESAQAMVRNKKEFGDKVCILRFEDLVANTSEAMHFLAEDLLGLMFNDVLLMPTFNKQPIKANTSFKVEQFGVIKDPISRAKTLNSEESKIIDDMAGGVYEATRDSAVAL